tara:strand:- start:639 stop:860 length:222 start_codon:yes stop_codon:yes gene_type:complete
MDNFDKLYESLMQDTFVSASLNYEDYKNRTDDELKSELDDLNKQDPKTFRANLSKKKQDINKEIESRGGKKDK